MGMNIHLSEMLSEILEVVSRGLSQSDEIVSTENMLHLVDSLNRDREAGRGAASIKLLLTAADARYLYPSLDHS